MLRRRSEMSGAAIVRLIPPAVARDLAELVELGGLALEAYRIGDRELSGQCERWHGVRVQRINARSRRAANDNRIAVGRTGGASTRRS